MLRDYRVFKLVHQQVFISAAADAWLNTLAALQASATSLQIGGKDVEAEIKTRVGAQMKDFPGYAQVRRVLVTLEPWSMENGLLTPTLKLKRPRVMEKFNAEIEQIYAGH